MKTGAADIYQLPKLYDILHARHTAWEVDGLEQIEDRFVTNRRGRRAWFEPACGTGRYLRRAAARGTLAVGIDLSDEMIAYATQRAASTGVDARFHVADIRSFSARLMPRGATMAFNLINSIRHLETDDDMLAHFRAIAHVLRPGAIYAVGISMSIYGGESPSEDVWDAARGHCKVNQIIQYVPPEGRARDERVISYMVVSRPAGQEMIESTYSLRRYDQAQWKRLIDRSPFDIIDVVDEEGVSIEPPTLGYGIYILRRRSD